MENLTKYKKHSWWLFLVALYLVHSNLNKVGTSLIRDIKSKQVLGQKELNNQNHQLAEAGDLPLVRMKVPENTTGADSEVDNSLFYARKPEEPKPKYVEPVIVEDNVVDLNAEIRRHLKLEGTTMKGAIVNGKYYKVGQNIEQYSIRDKKGKVLSATLTAVRGGRASIRVKNTVETLRLN